MQQIEQHHFLLFINSRSGGRRGQSYLSLGKQCLKFRRKSGSFVYVYFYDLFDKQSKEKGLRNVLSLSLSNPNTNVIICGGDGTVLWVVGEVLGYGVSHENVCFGIIPIGTGNDFSRSLGWGGSPISLSSDHIDQLHRIVQKWLKASKQNFDLWDVAISTYDKGQVVLSSLNVDQSQKRVKQYKKTLSNYLGVGIDARVSYHFEQRRTRSKYLNLILYGCLGLCFCCHKTEKMHEALQQFSQSESDHQIKQQESLEHSKQKLKQDEQSFRGKLKLLQKNQSSDESVVLIKKGYTGIVCLNCTSYMSGIKNVFSSRRIGARNKTDGDFGQPSFSDGKLEFVAYKHELDLGLEKVMNTAGRLTQGKGPFCLKFKQHKRMANTYVQIDGEAFNVEGLKEIRICKSKLTPTSQIRVLVNS